MKTSALLLVLISPSIFALDVSDIIGKVNPSEIEGVKSYRGFVIDEAYSGGILQTDSNTFFVISINDSDQAHDAAQVAVFVKEVPHLTLPYYYEVECYLQNQKDYQPGIVGEVSLNEEDTTLRPRIAWLLKTDPLDISDTEASGVICENHNHPSRM